MNELLTVSILSRLNSWSQSLAKHLWRLNLTLCNHKISATSWPPRVITAKSQQRFWVPCYQVWHVILNSSHFLASGLATKTTGAYNQNRLPQIICNGVMLTDFNNNKTRLPIVYFKFTCPPKTQQGWILFLFYFHSYLFVYWFKRKPELI